MNKGIATRSLYPLFSELTRLETELWDGLDNTLRKEYGLPMSRFEPMAVMDRLGACRVLDVATALAISVGGTSKLIDRIEKSGYCRRRNNPDDRRSSLIELTAEGRTILERARRTVDAELELRLAPAMSQQGAEELMELLRRLRDVSPMAAVGRSS
ncbi:DNA-binding MarR family transcriptional regulator [Paenarthrobacter nicotinovorans]|uniref:MarR family winged helix-turn-helix transcriptional regulator n=1 Tax=Micrococcaceae TaxID=1268 RepID=UPI00087670B8|nr:MULTISPECIES: MarR family winged helix-turn-helix transcriptional regulator [Micrococcaceae]MDR6435047.1 DNA-binding MarR family transcriptional regulator [Paenarthrobacter nicotinovorans]SCZ58998.1 DNA-binding transcriptional regulator, MarR family [Arthrobacter sp. UNCCL28]